MWANGKIQGKGDFSDQMEVLLCVTIVIIVLVSLHVEKWHYLDTFAGPLRLN